MRRTRFASLFLALLMVLMPAALAAQDASPAASPTMGECVAPEIPDGTPTPMEEMMPPEMAATPEEGMEASPDADDMAMEMPPMPEPLTGEPASDEQAAAAEAAVTNYWNCWNADMLLEVGALYTAAGLMEECGTDNIHDAPMCLGGLPVTLLAVDNAQVLEDGRIAIDTTYNFGNNMIRSEQFVFVEEGEFMLLDTHPELVPETPAGATEIDVELVDYAFELSATSAPAGEIVFNVANSGAEPHEFVMLSVPEGMDIMDALEDESLFAEVAFHGFAFAMPGESSMLVLTGMEPGTYTVVCFIPTAEGVPHVVEGMIAEFEVTEP